MDDEANHGTGEFQERTERLEEMLKDAEQNWKPIEYTLIIDELGMSPPNPYLYETGCRRKWDVSDSRIEEIKVKLGLIEAKPKKKADLREIAKAYSGENAARAEPERVQPKPYTVAQYENDKGMDGYTKVKHPNLRNYEDARAFLEMFGTPTLVVRGGEPRPLKECDPSRVIAAAIGKYEDAQTRLKEKKNNLREIVNGTNPEYE